MDPTRSDMIAVGTKEEAAGDLSEDVCGVMLRAIGPAVFPVSGAVGQSMRVIGE